MVFWVAACCIASVAGQERLTLREGDKFTGEKLPLSPAEAHLRTGVVMLVQVTRDLQTWIQTLYSMKQNTEEQEAIERVYVPIIEKLNSYIEVQGERLSAANYYGSQDLATALTALYVMAQQ